MQLFAPFHRLFSRLRTPQGSTIAAFVDDPLKVRKEIRFLLLRLCVVLGIAIAVVVTGIVMIRRNVRSIEEQRALQQKLYSRFDTVARLSHDVTEGRAALTAMQALFPKEDNLLPFLKAVETLAKETGNTAVFRFEQVTPTDAPTAPSYRFITYSLTVQGTMRTFLTYLAAMQSLPYAVVLDTMTVKSDTQLAAQSTMQLKGRLYVQ